MKAQRRNRRIALLSFTLGAMWVGNARPRPLYPLERGPVPILLDTGWPQGRSGLVGNISLPTVFRTPNRPFRSESLYRLSYTGLLNPRILMKMFGSIYCVLEFQKSTYVQYCRR
jgi:hypothetical protein